MNPDDDPHVRECVVAATTLIQVEDYEAALTVLSNRQLFHDSITELKIKCYEKLGKPLEAAQEQQLLEFQCALREPDPSYEAEDETIKTETMDALVALNIQSSYEAEDETIETQTIDALAALNIQSSSKAEDKKIETETTDALAAVNIQSRTGSKKLKKKQGMTTAGKGQSSSEAKDEKTETEKSDALAAVKIQSSVVDSEETKKIETETSDAMSSATTAGNEKGQSSAEADEAAEKTDEAEKTRIYAHEIELSFKYSVGEDHLGGGLCDGFMSHSWFCIPKSFISPKIAHSRYMDQLRELGLSNEYIVSTDYILHPPDLVEILVAEPVIPLDYFFELELKAFEKCKSLHNAKELWWETIKDVYTHIFTDVAHGLIYLDSLSFACGDLNGLIYINKAGRAKLLPLLDKNNADIMGLVCKMKDIITLPFPSKEIDSSYGLPFELARLFSFLATPNLDHVPVCWVFYHPFFWDSKEGPEFLRQLQVIMKENLILEKVLGGYLQSRQSFKMPWTSLILGDLFTAIRDYANVKSYDGNRPINVVRYFLAAFRHVNDFTYDSLRENSETYKEKQIEDCLLGFIPTIYVDLYEALCDYMLLNLQTKKKHMWCLSNLQVLIWLKS